MTFCVIIHHRGENAKIPQEKRITNAQRTNAFLLKEYRGLEDKKLWKKVNIILKSCVKTLIKKAVDFVRFLCEE